MSWVGLSSKLHHRPLRTRRLGVEVEHVLHTGDVAAIDLWNAPHVRRRGNHRAAAIESNLAIYPSRMGGRFPFARSTCGSASLCRFELSNQEVESGVRNGPLIRFANKSSSEIPEMASTIWPITSVDTPETKSMRTMIRSTQR
jgi:hypothetical protein